MGLFFKNEKILMGLRKYDINNCVWTFPGGRCELGESPKSCLKREVKEETGIDEINIICLLGKKKGVYKDSDGQDEVYMYKCTTTQKPKLIEKEKFIEWKWFNKKLLPENLIDPKDVDYIKKI